MPKVVFIGFGLAGLLCLLLGNAALFAWFIIRRRSKGVLFDQLFKINLQLNIFLSLLLMLLCSNQKKKKKKKTNDSSRNECMCECEHTHTFGICVLSLKYNHFKSDNFLFLPITPASPENKGSNQNSKSATIEMYAPSSYNDTVTGETLSSVSEKSDSYSNDGSQPDYMVSSCYSFCSQGPSVTCSCNRTVCIISFVFPHLG